MKYLLLLLLIVMPVYTDSIGIKHADIEPDINIFQKRLCISFGVDYILLKTIEFYESSRKDTINKHSGAIGRFQIMPILAKSYGYDACCLFNPFINSFIAISHLSYLKRKYGSLDSILTAYNYGEYGASKVGFKSKYAERIIKNLPIARKGRYKY